MTDPNEPTSTPTDAATDPAGDDLDGRTLEELNDYLDRGRTPADVSIDSSPGCQHALAALTRLRAASKFMLEHEAAAEPPRDEGWIRQILRLIPVDARAGRALPLTHPTATARLSISEGAVRGIIRAVGDTMEGLLIGRSNLAGDVEVPDAPVTITAEVSVFWGRDIPAIVGQLREHIYRELRTHTELNVVAIDVVVHDVLVAHPDAKDVGE